jgi:transposase
MVGRLKRQEADMESCGIDLAVRSSAICVMRDGGVIVAERGVPTEEEGLQAAVAGRARMVCVLEASPLAEWAAGVLEKAGHDVVVIDPRKAKGVIASKRKTDKLDARNLARMGLTGWYTQVHRKSPEARAMRTFLKARYGLVQTALAQGARIRGLLRAHGIRLGQVAESQFASRVRQVTTQQAPGLWPMLEPLVKVWRQALEGAERMKKQLERRASAESVPSQLMTAPGVGPLVASAYVATIDEPRRFRSGSQVAAYLGLVPSVEQSGQQEVHGRITREGDGLLRSYLIEAAQVLLTRSRRRCALKRWGLRLWRRKGFKKARVAVARKLAILLHHLWITGENFDPARA